MRRILSLLLILITVFSTSSCNGTRGAYEMLSEFVSAYGAEGIIYSSEISEGQEGYVKYDLLKKIYVFYRDFPEEFAIFLNSHADYGSECGVFICRDGAECNRVYEMCLERLRLLEGNEDGSFVMRKGRVVLYSAMEDAERAKDIWRLLLK